MVQSDHIVVTQVVTVVRPPDQSILYTNMSDLFVCYSFRWFLESDLMYELDIMVS